MENVQECCNLTVVQSIVNEPQRFASESRVFAITNGVLFSCKDANPNLLFCN